MEYSVAKLKTHLAQVLREVEKGETVEVTRHGKSVAVLIAKDDYDYLKAVRPSFTDSLQALREDADFTPLEEDDLTDLRDTSAGRGVNF